MAGKLLLQSSLLPLDSVGLGWFIIDVKNPQRQYHDPFPDKTLPATTMKESGWKEVARQVKGSKAGIRLTEFLHLFVENKSDDVFKTETALAVTYTLCQWEDTFRDACGLTLTCRWLEDAITDGKDVYFIVGYRTFLNCGVGEEAQVRDGKDGALRPPVSITVGSQIGIPLAGSVIDPLVVKCASTDDKEAKKSWTVEGESVYAVHYCKVNFKWISSRKINMSILGKNRWKIYLGLRGGAEAEEEMDDNVVEVDLSDEICGFNEDDILSIDSRLLDDQPVL
jgi:hypothetical protein